MTLRGRHCEVMMLHGKRCEAKVFKDRGNECIQPPRGSDLRKQVKLGKKAPLCMNNLGKLVVRVLGSSKEEKRGQTGEKWEILDESHLTQFTMKCVAAVKQKPLQKKGVILWSGWDKVEHIWRGSWLQRDTMGDCGDNMSICAICQYFLDDMSVCRTLTVGIRAPMSAHACCRTTWCCH
eukprot:699948-Pelagomonas_calceolata.AAC.3